MSELIHPGEKRFGARSAGRQAKSERTKAEIVEAAFEFLWSRPFREMTVNTLMANTSVSRPAFYQYFQDVHELMETLLVTLEQEILVGAEPWFTGAGDPGAPNYLPITPGWNYIVRLYQPRQEIIDGTFKFPVAEPAE